MWHLALAVEARQCPLSSGAPSAVRQCPLPTEVRGGPALIRPRDPHLAAGFWLGDMTCPATGILHCEQLWLPRIQHECQSSWYGDGDGDGNVEDGQSERERERERERRGETLKGWNRAHFGVDARRSGRPTPWFRHGIVDLRFRMI